MVAAQNHSGTPRALTSNPTVVPVSDDQWGIVAWLWQAYRHDLATVVNGLPYADGRYQCRELSQFPSADGAGYIAWRPHPNTGEDAPIGFAIIDGLHGPRRSVAAFWVAPPLDATGQAARSRSESWRGIQGPGRSHSSTTTLAPETSGGERPTQPSVTVVGQRNSGLCRENQRFPQITGLRPPDRLVSPTTVRLPHLARSKPMFCHGVVPMADRAAVVTRGGVFGARSTRRSRSARGMGKSACALEERSSTSSHSKCSSVPKSPSRTFLTRSNADAGAGAPGALVADPSEALPDGDQRSAA